MVSCKLPVFPCNFLRFHSKDFKTSVFIHQAEQKGIFSDAKTDPTVVSEPYCIKLHSWMDKTVKH